MTTTIVLTRRIYTQDALKQTAEAFAKLCTTSFTTEQDAYILRIDAQELQVIDELLNYALGLSAQELLR